VTLSSVDITTVVNVHHCHDPVLVIDSVDDPVGTAPCAESVVHRREKPLTDPVRLAQESAGDEFVGCCGNRLRHNLTQGTAHCGSRSQLVEILGGLVAHDV
jgi:hypothetical protein